MSIIIGSARIDENKKLTGGKSGDQKQISENDIKGEVSMQNFYVHSKGWYVLRAKNSTHATKLAICMKTACNNKHIGYDQNNRLGVIKYGTQTNVDTECDCSTLVRQCVIEATGTDPGNFTTLNEKDKLSATGLFENPFSYTAKTKLLTGDILVTKTKGHTVIVVSGEVKYPTLRKGSKGEYVKKLQTILKENGFATLQVDGDFGEMTKIAVIEFQGMNKLTKDGICGPKTWEKLLS